MAPRWLRDRIGPFPRKTGTAMCKTLHAVALLTLALAACQPQAPSTPATDGSPQDAATAPATEADAAFAALSKEWLDGWLLLNPRSEEHTSELQSLKRNSYAGICLKYKN